MSDTENDNTPAARSASVRFSAPAPFSFNPEDWPRWITRFKRYRRACRLDTEDADRQVDALLFAMGEASEEIFENLGLTAEEAVVFDTVVQKFEDYYLPKRKKTFERQRFYDVTQGSKTIEEFERELHLKAKYCEFVDKPDQLCDQFIRGLADLDLKERLCLEDNLTLDKVVTAAKQSERVKKELQSDKSSKTVDEVRFRSHSHGQGARPKVQDKTRVQYDKTRSRSEKPSFKESQSASSSGESDKCTRCGHPPHDDRQCPASGRTCLKCNKKGHFARMCWLSGNKVNEVTKDDDSEFELDAVYISDLDTIQLDSDAIVVSDDCAPWMETLMFCDSLVSFKIDTGADITVISKNVYNSLQNRPPLMVNKTVLNSPGGKLPVLGSFRGDILKDDEHYTFQVFVIDSTLKNNLLSRSVSRKLGLVCRADEVSKMPKIGRLQVEPVQIKLKDGSEPYAVHTARNIGFHLMSKVQEELKRMTDNGIIKPIETPTDWCAAMVPVIKKSGQVRICVDFKQLNQCVKRPYINLPNLDDVAPKLVGARYFSTLDANSGFHQVPLDEQSMPLTTFITPFGRFCFQRLPMGINIGPEVFQLQMQKVLHGLEGCDVIMDDILVWGATIEEHDNRLKAVKMRVQHSGLTLNLDKCQFGKEEVAFFGHRLSAQGIKASPERIEAISQMSPPSNITELRSLIGMLNYLAKFSSRMASVIRPMTELLKSGVTFAWRSPQQSALDEAKQLISELPSLKYFSLTRDVVVSADASSFGLGAVLLQRDNDTLVPIAFASRTLTDTEKQYAQIEKECLASVWACEKFKKYLVGLAEFTLWTDHKPLVPLISKKALDQAPVRCQRLLIRLQRFNPVVVHKPGRELVIADALSRNPSKCSDTKLSDEVELYVDSIFTQMPVTQNRLSKLRNAIVHDSEMSDMLNYVMNGWPVVSAIAPALKPFYEARDMLSVVDGLLTYQSRLVVPKGQRSEILARLHESHQGFRKCYDNAQRCVWWPGLRGELKTLCETCEKCLADRPAQRSEPLLPTELPSRPWEKVGADLCFHNDKNYLVLVDYYSRWLEIKHLRSITSRSVIDKCRQVFATHGIPEEFHSDNGSQFVSQEFKSFAEHYGFNLTTSSPYFAQANGEAESAVKMAKRILSTLEPDIGLMNYRATPHSATGVAPAVALMGRNLNTRIPALPSILMPQAPNDGQIRAADKESKTKSKENFDKHHGARSLKPLEYGDSCLVRNNNQWNGSGVVIGADARNRTYLVNTENGVHRRNRVHLLSVPQSPNSSNSIPQTVPNSGETPVVPQSQGHEVPSTVQFSPRITRLSSGHQIKKPVRYLEDQ